MASWQNGIYQLTTSKEAKQNHNAVDSDWFRENMLETGRTVGIKDAIITAYLDVLYREVEIGMEVGNTRVSESAPSKQVQSRESLLAAFLRDQHANWMRWFENEVKARYEATGGGLEIIADVLEKGFGDPKCLGVAFINIVAECSTLNWNTVAIAEGQKKHLARLLEQLTVKMGFQYPDLAASAAVFVIEQTIVRALMTGGLKEVQTARLLFQCLRHT